MDEELKRNIANWMRGCVRPRDGQEHLEWVAERVISFVREHDGAELAAARAERDALQAFKDYVHKRLDEAGVSVDPESPHKAAGCRIGGRLDEVFSARERAEAEAARLRAAIEAECNATIFEDGLSGDLRETGVRTLPQAYMVGRTDVLDELRAALAQEGGR